MALNLRNIKRWSYIFTPCKPQRYYPWQVKTFKSSLYLHPSVTIYSQIYSKHTFSNVFQMFKNKCFKTLLARLIQLLLQNWFPNIEHSYIKKWVINIHNVLNLSCLLFQEKNLSVCKIAHFLKIFSDLSVPFGAMTTWMGFYGGNTLWHIFYINRT